MSYIQKNILKPVLGFLCLLLYPIVLNVTVQAQGKVEGAEKKYVRIGSLQSHFSAYGSERAYNNSYYEGLIWPADYSYQDNAVIKRSWIACQDFKDITGRDWEAYALNITLSYEGSSIFPIELKQTAKFAPSTVFVDGINITAPYAGDVDEIDPDQIPDRIITNVINTSMGLTMTRRILVFSQQYHDNYFIKEFTFTNTGNIDYDDEIELNRALKGVRVSWGTRYSVCREGSFKIGSSQSWGQQSWVTKRGEDYSEHLGEKITEANPIVDWIRCTFSWAGQHSNNAFNNIGGPDVQGNGRLCAPQFAGTAILHVDKSAKDKSDDPNQPAVLGWHAGDSYPTVGDMSPANIKNMVAVYDMLSGNPYTGLGGTDRMYETYHEKHPDPFTIHNDAGGTNVWIAYGPFDLEPGESVTIVEAEGISGLNRQMCEQIGKRWKQAYDDPNDAGPFSLPEGATSKDKDEYKDAWVYTGIDSILQTFGRAKRNYDAGYQIPQPPLPPPVFEVNSGGDRIALSWSPSPSENQSDFAGYKIFRSIGKPDTTYDEIAFCEPGVTSFSDVTARRAQDYYYYIVAVNNGSNNSSGETNPSGQLYSTRFYTKTNEPANLKRQATRSLSAIRVVPNPFNLAVAEDFRFVGRGNRLMFYNLPGACTIRIYSERGDLIRTLTHGDGSGDMEWDCLTSSRQVVVSGIYIAHFTVDRDAYDSDTNELLYQTGDTAFRKFVIIR